MAATPRRKSTTTTSAARPEKPLVLGLFLRGITRPRPRKHPEGKAPPGVVVKIDVNSGG